MAKYEIRNVTLMAGYKNTEFDLEELAGRLDNVQYDPKTFPGLIYRTADPKITFLIFPSGKVNCSGAKRIEDAEKALKTLTEKLQSLGAEVEGKLQIKSQNLIASADFGQKFDLEKIAEDFEEADYRAEAFPKVVLMLKPLRAVFLLFRSGRGVCVGAKSEEEIREAVARVNNIRLEEFKKKLNVTAWKGKIPSAYKKWNERLADEFYSEGRKGRPAFLSLEKHKVKQLEDEMDDSLPKFVEAVRSLGAPSKIIKILLSLGAGWGRSEGKPPPFIAGLGLSVLAASEMGRAPDEVASHNYYHWLNNLLGRDEEEGRPNGFDKFYLLWKILNFWLEEICGGRRGFPTARQVGGHKHVGWPLSQALFRPEADKEELLELKEWLGIKDESPPVGEIAHGLSVWLEQEGAESRLANLFTQSLSAKDLSFTAEQLADILPDLEPTSETGVRRSTSRCAYLHLYKRYRDWGVVKANLSWKTKAEPGEYKAKLKPIGKKVDLRVSAGRAYIELDLRKTGVRPLTAEPLEFEEKARLEVDTDRPIIFVSGDGRGREGWWIQTAELGPPSEPHCIICRTEQEEEVSSQLDQEKTETEPEKNLSWLPKNFVLFPNVYIKADQAGIFTEYEREKSIPWELSGGLKIENNAWLKGALPKADAPKGLTEQLKVNILDSDGVLIDQIDTPFSLNQLDLSAGSYRIQASSGKSRKLVVRAPTWPPHPRADFKYFDIPNPKSDESISLSGAYIERSEEIPEPLILDSGKSVVLLGKIPGEVKKFSEDSAEEDLYEPKTDFEPQWKIILKNGNSPSVHCLREEPEPPTSASTKSAEKREKWAGYISEKANTESLTENQLKIFSEYIRISDEIKKERGAVVYVGDKNVMSYVLAVVTQVNKGRKEVTIKARGKKISKAVAAGEIAKNRFLKDFDVVDTEIGTDKIVGKNETSKVSRIAIKLGRKDRGEGE